MTFLRNKTLPPPYVSTISKFEFTGTNSYSSKFKVLVCWNTFVSGLFSDEVKA
jgi:hypothetical protein